jgi:putative FmdB family regulatory protein
MPLYEYQCESCEHRFERIQKFTDPPPSECPRCGGLVRKLVSSPAIQFKGSGFYITDYARAGGADNAGKDDSKAGAEKPAAAESSGTSGESAGTGASSSSEKPADTKKSEPSKPTSGTGTKN